MSAFLEITLISILLSVVTVIIQRLLTNVTELKKAKKEMADHKQEINKCKKAGDVEGVKRHTSLMMKASKSQFKYSTRSMLVVLVVVGLALNWLSSTYSGVAVDLSKSPANFSYKGSTNEVMASADGSVISINGKPYAEGSLVKIGDSTLQIGKAADKKLSLHQIIAQAPFNVPLLGRNLSWFWLYLIFTIPGTFILRKFVGLD